MLTYHHEIMKSLVSEHHRHLERTAAAERLARLARRRRRAARSTTTDTVATRTNVREAAPSAPSVPAGRWVGSGNGTGPTGRLAA